MNSKLLILLAGVLMLFNGLLGGDLRVNLINGTTNTPGFADRVVLMDLSAGMLEVASAADVNSSTTFSDINPSGQKQYLIQASLAGVSYSTTFVPTPDLTAWEASITLFDVQSTLSDIKATVPFFVIYAFVDKLYIQKRLILENHSDPPVTFFDLPGIINVHVPDNVTQMDYLTIKHGTTPLRTQTIDSDRGQVIPNALKPGSSEIDIAYYLPYDSSAALVSETVSYDIDHFHVYVMPMNMQVTAPGLKREGTDNENGLAIYAFEHVSAGTEIEFRITGQGMTDTESQGQQNTGKIVVEHRIAANNELILAGVLVMLILTVMFISIIRQKTDLKTESIEMLNKQRKALLIEYGKHTEATLDDKVKERILYQLIAVYKTLERIR